MRHATFSNEKWILHYSSFYVSLHQKCCNGPLLWNIWREYWIKYKKVSAPISSSNGFQVQKLIAFKCSTHFSRILQKNFKFINKTDAEKCSLFWCQFFAATHDLELNRKAQRRKNGMRLFCGWTKSDQKSFSHKTWSIITLCFLLEILILQNFKSKLQKECRHVL